MFGSLLILLLLPILDVSRIRGNQFRPLNKLSFWFFVVNFFILMWIGSLHPTEPFVTIGQISTGIYFAWFLIFTPLVGLIENTLFDIGLDSNSTVKSPLKRGETNKFPI
jgi:quinol-cytochrome oxidoreductase complex cytochrome b subunit